MVEKRVSLRKIVQMEWMMVPARNRLPVSWRVAVNPYSVWLSKAALVGVGCPDQAAPDCPMVLSYATYSGTKVV